MKDCPAGQYYCTKSKKCKPIPKGYHVMRSGYLTKDEDDGQKSKKNGNGNGNGRSGTNGSSSGNGNGNGNGSNGGGNGGGMSEGSLHKWFKGSKSKDGKGGWVNVVTGGTCASDEPGEGTPKCVSSAKRASMTKAQRLSASRRKKAADPGQQSKRGAAKPTYVKTDSKKKMKESKDLNTIAKELDKAVVMHKSQAKRIRKHAKDMEEACWKGYEKKGMKTMFGKRYPNCVKKEETEVLEHHQKDADGRVIEHGDGTPSSVEEGAAWTKKEGKNKSGGLNEKGRKSYERENPGSDLKAPSKKVGNPRRKSFCARMKGMKKKLTSAKTARDPDSRINKSLRAWNC